MVELRASEARDRIDEMLARVEQGETVVVTRDGRTIARLAPEDGTGAAAREADRRASVAVAMAALTKLRASIETRTTVDEILTWRHEGHHR